MHDSICQTARRGLVAVLIAIAWGSVSSAQEPAPPAPPGDNPSSSVTPEDLMKRLQQMEEMNRKLLEKFEDLSEKNEKLSKDNQNLKQQYQNLSKKVDAAAKPAKKPDDPKAEKSEKADSGLAGQGGWIKPGGGEGPEGARSATAADRGTPRATGARLLPYSQEIGNRYLGKVPLKAYFDYGHDGVGLETEDQEFQLKFRGEIQADYMGYLNPNGAFTSSGFYIPRVRYYFQGHATKPIDYQLSFQRSYNTFAPLNVYLNFNYDPRLQFRVGRFKVPYTYEFYKLNNWRLIAPERSLYNVNFQLNRMIGMMGWGQLFDEHLEYAAGVFDGPRNSFQDYNTEKDVVAFLNYRPFQTRDSFLKNLNVGGSVDFGNQNNPMRPGILRTNVNESADLDLNGNPLTNATVPFLDFADNVRERGLRELWELHFAYYYGGLSLLGAWDAGYESLATSSTSKPVQLPVGGYFVQLAYLITGETLHERAVIDPIHRFDLRPGKFGLGAFEPHARYSELNVGEQVFTQGLADPNLWTNRVQMVDVGVNWYLNRFIKVYLDWEHAMFAQPIFYQKAPSGLMKTSDLLWLRFQLYF